MLMRLNRLLLCIASAALMLNASYANAPRLELSELMRLLAQNTSGQARFTETRTSSLLDKPLQSSGELRYEAPARFIKQTRKPVAENLRVDGSVLQIERNGKTRTVELESIPEAMAIIDSVRGTLLGDRRALERVFAVEARGTLSGWTLSLLPTDPRVAQTISHVQVQGAERDVLGIEVLYADGDRSSTRIEPLRAR